MIEQLIQAISTKLHQVFGEDARILEVAPEAAEEQGPEGPCFFISHVSTLKKPLLLQRSFQANAFDIQYYPEIQRSQKEMLRMADQLPAICKEVHAEDGTLYRSTGVYFDIHGEVLHFFVNYNQ